jgi:hypothetical protein
MPRLNRRQRAQRARRAKELRARIATKEVRLASQSKPPPVTPPLVHQIPKMKKVLPYLEFDWYDFYGSFYPIIITVNGKTTRLIPIAVVPDK